MENLASTRLLPLCLWLLIPRLWELDTHPFKHASAVELWLKNKCFKFGGATNYVCSRKVSLQEC